MGRFRRRIANHQSSRVKRSDYLAYPRLAIPNLLTSHADFSLHLAATPFTAAVQPSKHDVDKQRGPRPPPRALVFGRHLHFSQSNRNHGRNGNLHQFGLGHQPPTQSDGHHQKAFASSPPRQPSAIQISGQTASSLANARSQEKISRQVPVAEPSPSSRLPVVVPSALRPFVGPPRGGEAANLSFQARDGERRGATHSCQKQPLWRLPSYPSNVNEFSDPKGHGFSRLRRGDDVVNATELIL